MRIIRRCGRKYRPYLKAMRGPEHGCIANADHCNAEAVVFLYMSVMIPSCVFTRRLDSTNEISLIPFWLKLNWTLIPDYGSQKCTMCVRDDPLLSSACCVHLSPSPRPRASRHVAGEMNFITADLGLPIRTSGTKMAPRSAREVFQALRVT